MISGVDRYPTPKVVALVFVICMVLVVIVGGWVQLSAFPGFLPGLYITEWILILGPPLIFLKRKGMEVKKALGLEGLRFKHVLLGFLGGVGSYFIFMEIMFLMEVILGPYPEEFLKPLMKWFPTSWLEFIPWILGMAFSAGICEETLFRGFIQNGLERSWGPSKALVVASVLFGVFHLDPWRSPPAVFIGLVAGCLLLKTRSLYAAMALHTTTNSIAQILAFINYFPPTEGIPWIVLLVLSAALVVIAILS